MNIKGFMAVIMVFCVVLAMCACTSPTTKITPATNATTEATTVPVDDGKVTYTVKVVDEGGNAIASAAVQLCKDTCLPGMTNAEGVATFRLVEDDYKVSFMTVPEGYNAEPGEFYFADGSYELTITLKAVA